MVLLQGAGSCPTHSTAYQPHIQLSMKEGWKDGEIIGQSGSERQQASKGQRMEGCSDKAGRGMGSWWEEGVEKFGWRMEGLSRGVYLLRGPVARSQAVSQWAAGEAAILSLSFPLSLFLSLPLFLFKLPPWWTPELLSFSLISLSLFSYNQPTDRRTGAMMDDALSESDNIFSQSPKQDRAASEVGRCWPLSVFVRSNCGVQSPLSRPPYQLRWACANWSWPHGPAFSKSAHWPCHNI